MAKIYTIFPGMNGATAITRVPLLMWTLEPDVAVIPEGLLYTDEK